MFFKTKMCSKFRAGACPYPTNCNFAHSVEELRRPPPNWQELVAAREEDKGNPPEAREEYQIPAIGFAAETQRSHKGRHCKKFYTEEGCPYGENCTFLHDEQSKNRESVAISLGPGGFEGSGAGTAAVVGGNSTNSGPSASAKPSNWKTRICNKWELTGYCPFGAKCHFAHGAAELHRYGGGLVEGDGKDTWPNQADAKQGNSASDTVSVSGSVSEGCHGVPAQRSAVVQRSGQRSQQKWKGPDRISKIYGDWIDDVE